LVAIQNSYQSLNNSYKKRLTNPKSMKQQPKSKERKQTEKMAWWWWVVAIVVPFGGLLALYQYFKNKKSNTKATPTLATATGNSLSIASSVSNSSTVPLVAPIYVSGYPVIKLNHAQVNISNAGSFHIVFKKVGSSTDVNNETITGPTTALWLSLYIPHDGANYELIINGYTTLLTAPNDIQNSNDYIDESTNDGN
jgi:hypothetical protein